MTIFLNITYNVICYTIFMYIIVKFGCANFKLRVAFKVLLDLLFTICLIILCIHMYLCVCMFSHVYILIILTYYDRDH
jgi:hypothetical protein